MSRRAIRRFEQQTLEATNAVDGNSTDDSATPGPAVSPTSRHVSNKKKSVFQLLALDDDDDDDDDDGGGDRNGADASTKSAEQDDEGDGEEQAPKPEPAAKKKKRKKRKQRKNKQAAANAANDDDPDWVALKEAERERERDATPAADDPAGFIPRSFFSPDDDDELRDEARRIMAMIEALAFPDAPDTPAPETPAVNPILVEPRLLSADAELKRLFGTRVVESERRAEEVSSRRRRGGMLRPTIKRKVSLVAPRETWADHAPGLIMEEDREVSDGERSAAPGVRFFRYAHSGAYAKLQAEYRTVVQTHDPNFLADLCARHPYHVDSLLQLAELHRQMGELERAAEHIERGLYVLEAAWHVSFKPFDAACRLRFSVTENRSLYVALFRYSQLLTRKGLHRTALEVSKLLLNFDPCNDPMGVLLVADSYALLSAQYDWPEVMRSSFPHLPVRYFPNFAASASLALEMTRSAGSTRPNNTDAVTTSGGRRLGSAFDDDPPAANDDVADDSKHEEKLTDTLLTFPMLLRPILEAIGDSSSSIWLEFRLFDEGWHMAGCDDGGMLARMASVYAARSKLLWNAGRSKDLLISCARAAGKLDDAAGMGKDPKTGRLTSMFVSDEVAHARVARCRALRVEAANWLGQSGLYRNVQLADFVDSTTNLPAEILAGEGAQRPVGAPRQRTVSVGQGALEFLHSLLPWRNAADAYEDE